MWSGALYDQVRVVDRVSTDVLHDRVAVVMNIGGMIIQSHLRWYGHVMRGDINSQTQEVMEVEITGKRKKGQLRKSVKRRIWNDMAGEERMRTIEKNGQSKLEQKLLTPASRDNGIKTDIVVVVVVVVAAVIIHQNI